jgi:predicted unusual protein kinase regulating ubiquinone biosynthesis (AarF/ABC1/UbiB family)
MDLENEAQSQRRFARGYRGHPFILIPAPVTDLARTDVLVSEWVDGVPFDEVLGLGDEVRDRYGEVLIRFHLGALSRADTFHADPHPGNHRLSGDGRVAFLDFGSTGSAAPPAWLSDLLIEAVTTPDAREPALDALVRRGRLPAGDLLAARMAVGLAAVLTWLRPNGDWSAMGRELKRAGNGATALGEAEAAFWAARGRRW